MELYFLCSRTHFGNLRYRVARPDRPKQSLHECRALELDGWCFRKAKWKYLPAHDLLARSASKFFYCSAVAASGVPLAPTFRFTLSSMITELTMRSEAVVAGNFILNAQR
jgi:hypothetical protein